MNCKRIRSFFRALTILLLRISTALLVIGINISSSLPSSYQVTTNEPFKLESYLPINSKINNLGEAVNADSNINKHQITNANIMLMNSIPIKSVTLDTVQETKVIPCGTPFGVKLYTDGVMIIGISDIQTENGLVNPAKNAGIHKGDIIISINNKKISGNEDVANIVSESNGSELSVQLKRNNSEFETKLSPVKTSLDQSYKVGIWVRDSSAGIGTLTFYDPQTKSFAGLGHGICDNETGEILPLAKGDIVNAEIDGVIKGAPGAPGELKGYFCENGSIGVLKSNSQAGIYGSLNCCPIENESIPIAMKQQVKPGDAKILTTIDGKEPSYYDISITHVDYNENTPTKNMIISIKDDSLINATGGIVQGMSGSPIIQDGKLVGAITHVFVNDPTKGYAIFSENMLTNSNAIYNIKQKNAS